jgi:hypothetical protein
LVDEELARAVRTESRIAVEFWWGASESAVYSWRKALAVPRPKLAPAEIERRRRTALELRLRPTTTRPNGSTYWKAEELALLGTMPDAELAAKLGRTVEAVRLARTRRGISTAHDRRHDMRGKPMKRKAIGKRK